MLKNSKTQQISEHCTVIDLLRHGATGDVDVFRGSIDLALSSEGWQQMRRVVPKQPDWKFVASSPLIRCQSFAQELSRTLDVDLQIDINLREISFGLWEGKTAEQIWMTSPDALLDFWKDADAFPPPQGEKLSSFYERTAEAFKCVVQSNKGSNGIIVCHGGVVRMILAYVLNIPLQSALRIHVPYACATRLHVYHHDHHDDTYSLIFHNGAWV